MKNAVIYCFSGSGNTEIIAETVKSSLISEGLTCELKHMEDGLKDNHHEYDLIGLMFPVAIQSSYPLVWDFIHGLPESKGQNIFMIDTMQSFSGGIVGPLKMVLKNKGYSCIGALELKMTSSIQTKVSSQKDMNRKNLYAIEEAIAFTNALLKNKTRWARVPYLSDLMRSISNNRKIWTSTSMNLSIHQAECIKCKICIRNCPVNALSIKNDLICINHDTCISCVRCVHHCPKDAFRWKGKKVHRVKR